MLGPNATMINTTAEDIFLYPGSNSSSLPPPPTLTSLLASLLPSLDYSQLLYKPQSGWVPLNHVYYQVSNLFLLLSSMAPNSPGGFLFLRAMLVVSSSCCTVWGWTVACGVDITGWSSILAVVNMAWCVQTVWRGRTVSLSQEMEVVYEQMFHPLNVLNELLKFLYSKYVNQYFIYLFSMY